MSSDQVQLSQSQRDRATALILSLNEELETLRAFAHGELRPGMAPVPEWVFALPKIVPTDTPRDRLLRWSNVFDDELNFVRAARNTVAHARRVSDDDLAVAVRAAARLLVYARVSSASEDEHGLQFEDHRIAEALRFAEPGPS